MKASKGKLTLFFTHFRLQPALVHQSNKAVFSNEELIQLSIEKLRGLLSLGIKKHYFLSTAYRASRYR